MFDNFFSALFVLVMGFGLIFLLALLFVFLPVKLAAKADCLEQGYPQARVSWNLNKYCVSPYSNLGDTNPKVVPLN